MTVEALSQALSLQVFHLAEPGREVTGGYCGRSEERRVGKEC